MNREELKQKFFETFDPNNEISLDTCYMWNWIETNCLTLPKESDTFMDAIRKKDADEFNKQQQICNLFIGIDTSGKCKTCGKESWAHNLLNSK